MIVIIGILVAVQVNNRNEEQRDKASEIVILKAIKAELENDFDLLAKDLDVHKSQVRSSLIIINQLENNRPYHDSLASHFLETCNYTILALNKGGYETLKSLGVGIINNMD